MRPIIISHLEHYLFCKDYIRCSVQQNTDNSLVNYMSKKEKIKSTVAYIYS